MNSQALVVGIDTGGTFTDVVLVDGDTIRAHKEPSTPDNPARAVLAGLRQLVGESAADIVHGSTVATNALLERKGARTLLITTEGFEDVIEIGRQIRPAIYDIHVTKPEPLVSAERRIGLRERVTFDGSVLTPLDADEVARAVRAVGEHGADAVAICFLHSYANPGPERTVRDAIRASHDVFVTASSDVLPEFREYERTSTTAVNAFVGPVMDRYLGSLGTELGTDRVRIMQSNGGILSLDAARQHAVHTVLSGPAGGAVGGFELARRSGYDHVITFDMGGTSTDVSLAPGELSRTADAEIGGLPIRVPVIDIHTVGAGGGSIAYRDPGGSLRVGPESAGAVPGPICYDRGGERLTVTDANLFLGRLSPNHFLGGAQSLPTEPVERAMNAFADALSLEPVAAAEGVLRVANATMERAIRVISLERGHDPRDFTLICFGGAGGMHAADLARGLGIPRVLVPHSAGILSALGMLLADFIRDYSRTVLIPVDEVKAGAFVELEARARNEAREEGVAVETLQLERSLDMRYVGQGYELAVPYGPDVAEAFHSAHDRRYGYADPDRAVEVVNVRVRSVGATAKPHLPHGVVGNEDASEAVVGHQDMVFDGRATHAPIYHRERLAPGHRWRGPALVVEYSTTTVVPPDLGCWVDEGYNLVLERL